MKIAVVGAGSIGGYYGAMLQKCGYDVTFIARGKHLEAMRKQGLQIHSPAEKFTVSGNFTDDFNKLRQADLLLFTVKSTQTKETAEKLQPFLKENTAILTLQNGVNNEEILSEVLGEHRIVSGASYVSAHIEKPGVIRRSQPLQLTVIGGLLNTDVQHIENFGSVLTEAGIEVKVSDSILQSKWDKLLWNATFNPLSAAALASVGDILDQEPLRKTAEAVLAEVIQVGEGLGFQFDPKWVNNLFIESEIARKHKTSMLQDRETGKKMEVEALCGYFTQKGRQLGIETPTIGTIYAILRSINEQISD